MRLPSHSGDIPDTTLKMPPPSTDKAPLNYYASPSDDSFHHAAIWLREY